jgi:phosphate transport system permease protein
VTTLLDRDAPAGTPDGDVPLPLKPGLTGPDRVFRAVLMLSGMSVLGVLVAIILYLVTNSWAALHQSGLRFIASDHWAPPGSFGILGDLGGSVMIAVLALVLALPVSVATALMINEYAPRQLRKTLVGIVDLLATVPSIVYGFWGLVALSTYINGPTKWLGDHAGFIPLLRSPQAGTYGNSIFLCGVVVAVMIIPIITSITREVMSQVPRETCEAALALGGTKWGMVTDVVLPFSRNGIVGGALLGLGRALGETMAVVIILSSAHVLTLSILGPAGLGSVAKLIADFFETSPPITRSALILAGLTLFATTLGVNLVARVIVGRAGKKAP